MAEDIGSDVYADLGVVPVINAGGSTTRWGGSTPSPAVKRAMEAAEKNWAEIEELLEGTGARIAEVLGVESAYVTTGCYAALALSTAVCITRNDPDKIRRLPDTTGMKNEILLQKRQRYSFDRCFTVCGGKLVEVGDDEGCNPEQLEAAMGDNTAALAYYVQPDGDDNVVALEDAVEIARKHDVPVIVDAASRIFPLDYFKKLAQSAELVCFAGKYMNAPQSTGFVCGRKDLVEAVAEHGFASARPLGRAMKLDRQDIVGVVASLTEWFSMDHEARFADYDAKFATILNALEGAPNVREAKVVKVSRHPGVTLHVVLDSAALGKTAQEVVDELYAESPRIRVLRQGEDTLNVNVHTLNDGEDRIVADRLRRVLTMRGTD